MGRISEDVTGYINEAGQTPPHSKECEEMVLGAIMQNNALINHISPVLKPEDLHVPANAVWYKGMVDLAEQNSAISPVLVANKVGSPDSKDALEKIKASCTDPSTFESYLSVVVAKSLHRRMARVLQKGYLSSYNEKGTPDKVFEETTAEMFKLFSASATKGFRKVDEVGRSVLDRIEAIGSSGKGLSGLNTGFSALNEITAGLQDEDLIIIAARPSVGKTALGMGISRNATILEKAPVAIFSLEMSAEALVQRLLSSDARVDSQKIRKPMELNTNEWRRLSNSLSFLYDSDLYFDDTPMVTPMQVRAKCRRLAFELMLQGKRLRLIVVDYLQLMSSSEKRENRQQEVTSISRELKAIAKEMKCPVIALSQLSRQPEKRDDPRPKLTDLRESGALEQDADLVAFIYREEQHQATPMNTGQAEIIIAKQRMGPTDTVILGFQKQFTRFENTFPEGADLILT
jgi:replicative DNA helicase